MHIEWAVGQGMAFKSVVVNVTFEALAAFNSEAERPICSRNSRTYWFRAAGRRGIYISGYDGRAVAMKAVRAPLPFALLKCE
jgi:hypothetical protein